VIFGIVVLYLRCRHNSSYSLFGDQRYESVPQDEDGFPLITPANGHKTVRNSHAMPSDSEDDSAEEALFVSQSNKPLLI
jgi:hypothetical protein